MTLAKLIEERRALEIALYAKHVEIAQALGEPDDVKHWQKQWSDAVHCRNAALEIKCEEGGACYFDAQGAIDRSSLHLRAVIA